MSHSFLATYGSLMRAFDRQSDLGVAEDLAFVARCQWAGRMYDLGSFPGAVPGEGTIHGELFRVTDSRVWTVLDRYEGYEADREEESLFVRRKVPLDELAGQAAWVYWYNRDPTGHQRVSSGDWLAYRGGMEAPQ